MLLSFRNKRAGRRLFRTCGIRLGTIQKMRNIFLLYIAHGNYEQVVHYQDTIKNRVLQERIFRFIDPGLKGKLVDIFGNKPIAVWGSRDSSVNRQKFERMSPGDDILIIEGDVIKLLGKIAVKTISPELSKELWKNLKGETTEGWDLIYFIANPQEINLPFTELKKLLNYLPDYQLRGFMCISESKLEEFYSKYDDLYSILLRIRNGEPIEEKKGIVKETVASYGDDIKQETFDGNELSDHIVMQWKLARLGKKSGSKVWIPKNDQQRIVQKYQFTDFENEFTAGIDIPAKYVENIDVVWKEEFRIDAAFEIENTTSIYSGLLRLSDLKVIAPNSNYPLFVVTPSSRHNRLIDQVRRPTFRKLELEKKIRYLSYDAIDEIDNLFKNSTAGFSVNLLFEKSEAVDNP